MDVVGTALAPNALTVARELEELARRREQRGEEPLEYVFPDRGARRPSGPGPQGGGQARSAGPSEAHLARVEREYGPVGLQAFFGFEPFLDAASRPAVFDAVASPYEPVAPGRVSALFSAAGIAAAPRDCVLGDPAPAPSCLTVYAVSPFVLMADVRALEGRGLPVPRGWEDVLDPAYRGVLAMTAEDPACNPVSLGVHARFGDAGLEELLANVAYSASASVIGMVAGTHGQGPACIFAVPWFFARICASREGIEVVWPREGALAFPLWLALRRDASAAAREVAAYFTGEAYARGSAALCMPCANVASDACVPGYPDEPRDLAWPGWDYLRRLDVAAYAARAQMAGANIPRVSGAQEARAL